MSAVRPIAILVATFISTSLSPAEADCGIISIWTEILTEEIGGLSPSLSDRFLSGNPRREPLFGNNPDGADQVMSPKMESHPNYSVLGRVIPRLGILGRGVSTGQMPRGFQAKTQIVACEYSNTGVTQ